MADPQRDLVLKVHEAMQNAPHDGKDFRQARAAIAAVSAESAQAGDPAAPQRTATETARAFVNGFWGMVEKVPGGRGERLVEKLAELLTAATVESK